MFLCACIFVFILIFILSPTPISPTHYRVQNGTVGKNFFLLPCFFFLILTMCKKIFEIVPGESRLLVYAAGSSEQHTKTTAFDFNCSNKERPEKSLSNDDGEYTQYIIAA